MPVAPRVANALASDPTIATDTPVSSKTGRFTRQQRLIRPQQFKRVFSRSVRVGDDYFAVLGQNSGQPVARLGLAIARKHIKKAVGRNRIKRLVRESFRHQQALLAGLDIVVTLRRDASQLSNRLIQESLIKHWHSLKQKCAKHS